MKLLPMPSVSNVWQVCSAAPTPIVKLRANDSRSKLGGLEVVHRIMSNLPGAQDLFRETIIQCASSKPQWARIIVLLTALYLHLGPFSRHVICKIDQQLDEPQPIEADPRSAVQQPDVAISV
jgi:hypothetical protein